MKYEAVKPMSRSEVEQIISWNDPDRLYLVPVALGLYCDDLHWAIGQCIDLAKHKDPKVRGSALLSFGHFARRFRCAHRSLVEPLIQEGLRDKDPYVKGHASDAADDIDHFCTWKVNRKPKSEPGGSSDRSQQFGRGKNRTPPAADSGEAQSTCQSEAAEANRRCEQIDFSSTPTPIQNPPFVQRFTLTTSMQFHFAQYSWRNPAGEWQNSGIAFSKRSRFHSEVTFTVIETPAFLVQRRWTQFIYADWRLFDLPRGFLAHRQSPVQSMVICRIGD